MAPKKKIGAKRALNTTHVELHLKKEKKRPAAGGIPGTPQLDPYKFKPGVSGNPGGRPKGTGKIRISDAYAGVMAQDASEDIKIAMGLDPNEKFTYAECVALQMIRKSLNTESCKPSFKAVQELREVTEGKLPEKSELGGPNGSQLPAGVGMPVVNVNFRPSPHASASTQAQPANVPVAESEVNQPEQPAVALNLPDYDQGF